MSREFSISRINELLSEYCSESYALPLSRLVVCVVGPTASGKTDLAQVVALELNGEVVSADSMQIYEGMDIGTGKIPAHDRVVPHHGFNLVKPGEAYSAALFQGYARNVFRQIDEDSKTSVLAGGTGLYVRAAIDSYDFPSGEQVDNPVRDFYTQYAQEHGAEALWELLSGRDPESAAVLHPNNVRRVVRAFELLEVGESYANQVRNLASLGQDVPAVFVGLQVTPEILRGRINRRVDKMVDLGLVDEVQRLLDEGFREGITAPQAIGYKEIVSALDGEISMEEAIEGIKAATRRYAKRQRTWFRKDKRIIWVDADSGNVDEISCLAFHALQVHLEESLNGPDEKGLRV